VTSSVTHAAAVPAGGVKALPNALVVLVNTNEMTPAATASFQKIECSGDIGIDEALPAVSHDVRFVEGRRVEYCFHTMDTAFDVIPIHYGADPVREL
jgi:hypothetical protein